MEAGATALASINFYKMKQQATINTLTDGAGNLIIAKDTGKSIVLGLKLASEQVKRTIGVINKKTRTLYVKRTYNKHYYHKLKAYGFNYKIIVEAKLYDTVQLQDDTEIWQIPREHIIKSGTVLNHINAGFELQIMVPLASIKEFKIKDVL